MPTFDIIRQDTGLVVSAGYYDGVEAVAYARYLTKTTGIKHDVVKRNPN